MRMKHNTINKRTIGFLLTAVPILIVTLVQCTANNPSKPVAVPIMTPTLSTNPDFIPLPPEATTKPAAIPETVPAKQLPLPPVVKEPEPMSSTPATPSVPPVAVEEPTKIDVDVSTQTLSLYAGDKLLKTYPISSAKNGVGSRAGSDRTPLGRHYIAQKIGNGAPQGAIFKARVNTGKIVKIDAEKEDVVTSRIMWLKGTEPGKNVGAGIDSYQRFIYIHGTNSEKDIGRPASHGCIRMYNKDVIELFDQVKEGLEVNIICSKGQDPGTQECQYDAVVEQKRAAK